MDADLESLVWKRAGDCCEYCWMPQAYDELRFEIDHVVAQQHRGPTTASNLALACFSCNRAKGPNLSGIPPGSKRVVRLFHPRRHKWERHFRWDGPWLVGRTDIGRATVATLAINAPLRVRLRIELIADGMFPTVAPNRR